MSYESRRQTRYTTMDIVMGVFYIIIGAIVFFRQNFANMPIPAYIAYLLGGMMMIGGGARLYRGLKMVLPKKKDNSITGE